MDKSGSHIFLERDALTESSLALPIQKILFKGESPFQKIVVFDTGDIWGKVLTLDGVIMLNERDEFAYHEMISHIALHTGPVPKKVLIVGGGDGGTLRECLKHPNLENVTVCEIDQEVIRICQKFFPQIASGFSDPRVRIHIDDAVKFVSSEPDNTYDVVLLDTTDPVSVIGERLFGTSFLKDIQRILRNQGVTVGYIGSPFGTPEQVREITQTYRSIFLETHPFFTFVPEYDTGCFGFVLASNASHPLRDQRPILIDGQKSFRYYNEDIHRSVFTLPNFVKELTDKNLYS